ncbi:MAG: phosphoenolpyruvate carboxylase [Candidatus Puniceispirillaceae bacterium]
MCAQRDFAGEWLRNLYQFRSQGMQVTDVNPVSALADLIGEQLYDGEATAADLRHVLDTHAAELWQDRVNDLRRQTGLDEIGETSLPDLSGQDITRPIYRAVFTAHPVFALRRETSDTLCDAATTGAAEMPEDAFAPRDRVTLDDEHAEAMQAVRHARGAVNGINADILRQRQVTHSGAWRDSLPGLIGVSTWVGYDLDGRSDISWIDSFCLRLREKAMALEGYRATIEALELPQLAGIAASLDAELQRVTRAVAGFEEVDAGDFTSVINDLTDSGERLVSSGELARTLHTIARDLDDDAALQVLVLAADVAMHGFGMGEVHLRINAAQIRNAMRPVDGRAVSVSNGAMSSRMLIERLASRIQTESPWQINFANLDAETATARRQLMLATQILKHIDSDQPIRLLIAECERPITIMSALYLAHKFDIADNLDISPLFETGYGLEHGDKVIDQLLQQPVFVDYVRRRGRLSIQTGFSDAGRFVGQIAANMAIERLQLKLLRSLQHRIGDGVDLLIFNTHGESLGRGSVQAPMADRQAWLMTPYVRHQAATLGVGVYHQSSFQGGDGYRLFGTADLATSTMRGLLAAEAAPQLQGCADDLFYQKTDFSLDLFLELKIWHEALVADPNYGDLIDLFGSNLLPPTGSRPTKRVVQAGGERRGPSKIRAIAHNAILQQVGFLANVISGMGRAATVDIDEFVEVHRQSPRLRQCLDHVLAGKQLGSLNTVLAYCRLADPGFWVNRAYHGKQQRNQRALRRLAKHLRNRPRFRDIQQTVWALRDDLVDLYRLVDKVGEDNARVTGERRGALDLLHAIRLAIVTDSLMVICRTPNLGESNQYSNDDILALGLSLDFAGVAEIIRDAFSRKPRASVTETLNESETYSSESGGNFAAIEREILHPLQENQLLIDRITQMVSAHYGAHG